MISGTLWRRHSAPRARACSSLSVASAILLRYCRSRAPPATAASTMPRNAEVLARSGVTAYRPLISTFISGALLAHPEQTVRNMLAHARAKRGFQRLPGIFLRIIHRIADLEAIGDGGGDGGGERAAGAVVGA